MSIRSVNRKLFIYRICFYLVVVFILIFLLFPFYFVFTTSLKAGNDAFSIPPKFFFKPTMQNYSKVVNNSKFINLFKNSVLTSTVPTAVSVLLGMPAAYALAQLKFKNKHRYTMFVLFARVMPPMTILFPMYVIFSNLRLVGSYIPMFFIYTMFLLPLVVWLMPVYFKNIPGELREAAIIDGCSEWMVFSKVMLPLVKSGLTATVIFCVIQAWNEFLIALIFTNSTTQTMAVNVTTYMTFQGTEWGPMCAAGTIIILPMIIFGLMIQNNFVKGMTIGAVKG